MLQRLAFALLAIESVVHAVLQPSAASAQTSPQPNSAQAEAHSKARDQLNHGVQAFENARYTAAVEHFTTAVELDPNFITAPLYLATTYMQQYIPGSGSPDNMKMADNAQEKLISVNPSSKRGVLHVGRDCLDQGFPAANGRSRWVGDEAR